MYYYTFKDSKKENDAARKKDSILKLIHGQMRSGGIGNRAWGTSVYVSHGNIEALKLILDGQMEEAENMLSEFGGNRVLKISEIIDIVILDYQELLRDDIIDSLEELASEVRLIYREKFRG